MAARALPEDFQNQQRAIVDWQFKMSLQIALLRRTQTLVEQYLERSELLRQQFDFIRFATAHKQRRVRRLALAA